MTRVAIIQSNYIPWKGYFDIIHEADVFVFYDEVQYTKNDWRNRNKIKTAQGPQWLTIPVGQAIDRRVCDVALPDPRWQTKHWKTVQQNYRNAPGFSAYSDFFEDAYCKREWTHLSALNQYLTERITTELLGARTRFVDSRGVGEAGDRIGRLINILTAVKATTYISGPAARDYVGEGKPFADAGIEVVYMDYAGYPEYPQLYPPFEHYVSVVDILFCCGKESPHYVWGWRDAHR